MLLDAGEGTWQQMVRMAYNNPSLIGLPSTLSKEPYTEASAKNTPQEKISTEAPFKSSAKVNTSIKNPSFKNNTLDSEISVIPPTIEEILARQLQVIWISHPHADHHLGLLTILSERKKLLTTCRNPCNVRERGKGTNAIDSSSGSNGEDAINNEVVSTDIGVSEEGEYGGRPEGETDDGFVPVVLIAPPSVLAFLRDYSLVDKDNLIRGSYIPISSRLFDKKDLCGVGMGDSYWCDPNDDMYNTENTYHNSNKYYNQDRSNYNTKKYDRNNDNDRDLNNKIGINLEHNKNKFGFSSQSASVLHDRVESKPLWYMTAQLHLANGKKLLDKIGIEIENVKVLHCPQAYGVVVTVSLPNRVRVQTPDVITPRKMKIVYSGDTRPSALLCDVGRDCALLIHEATFEDDETGNIYTYMYI
jgi:ribonuclease BN (tRNA processing enzyme)